MPLELERTFSSIATNDTKGVSVVPQFVSILNNSKGSEPSIGAGKNCVRPCYGQPPPCYGEPPPCYGGR